MWGPHRRKVSGPKIEREITAAPDYWITGPSGRSRRASSGGLASVPWPSFSGQVAVKALLFEGGARAFCRGLSGLRAGKSANVGHLREALLGGRRIPIPIAVCRLRRQRGSAVLQVTATPVGRQEPRRCRFGLALGGLARAGTGRRGAAAAARGRRQTVCRLASCT
jgi:hypothetical protein